MTIKSISAFTFATIVAPMGLAASSGETEDIWSRCAICFGAGSATNDAAYVKGTLQDTMHAASAQSYGTISGTMANGVISNVTLDVFNPTASNAIGAARCLYARQTATANTGVTLDTNYTIAESQKKYTILTRVRCDATNTASTGWILAAHNWTTAAKGGGGISIGPWYKYKNATTGKHKLRVVIGQSDNTPGSGEITLGEWVDLAVVGDDEAGTLSVGLKSASDKHYTWFGWTQAKVGVNSGFFRPWKTIKLFSYNKDNPFHGAMQFFAIWNEALSKDEIYAAFSDHRRTTWSLGTRGCGANMFVGESASTVKDVSTQITEWGKVPSSFAANGGVRIPFSVRENEAKLPQYVRIGAVEGSGRFSVTIDETLVGIAEVTSEKVAALYVNGAMLTAGNHTCTLLRTDASPNVIKLDFADMGGSYQLGVDNDSTGKTAGDSPTYVHYRTDNAAVNEWKTVLKPIVTNEFGTIVRHYAAYSISTNIHAFPKGIDFGKVRYRVKFYDPHNVVGKKIFFQVNGVLKATETLPTTFRTTFEYTFHPNELVEGDNSFVWSIENAFRSSEESKDKDFYCRMDYQRFIIGRPKSGMFLFVK